MIPKYTKKKATIFLNLITGGTIALETLIYDKNIDVKTTAIWTRYGAIKTAFNAATSVFTIPNGPNIEDGMVKSIKSKNRLDADTNTPVSFTQYYKNSIISISLEENVIDDIKYNE